LTAIDERKLRAAFNQSNNSHETMEYITKGAMFVGFWPLAYKLARISRPSTVFFFAGTYLAGYKYGVQPFALQMLQNSLNDAAAPFATKYVVTV
jgi:hypothetical protein